MILMMMEMVCMTARRMMTVTVLSTPRMLTMTMMVFWMRMTSCNFTSVVIMSLDMDSVIRFSKWTLNVS